MKIAVTASGPDLDSQIESRFGRCQYFIIVDTDTMEYEAIQNPNVAVGGGAGIQSAQMMAQKDVEVVLTGNCGPNAFRVFSQAGIKIVTGVSGLVRESVEKLKSGTISEATTPSVNDHFGIGGGKGMGSGAGRRMREISAPSELPSSRAEISKSDELVKLKEQADQLKSKLDQLIERIKEVEDS